LRMGADRYPHQVLFSLMHDAGAAPRGAPHISLEKCVTRDLKDLQVPTVVVYAVQDNPPQRSWCAFQAVPCLFPAPLQPPAAACPDAAAAQLG
jgi:hypothetical protein